jgi:hypothetical protein
MRTDIAGLPHVSVGRQSSCSKSTISALLDITEYFLFQTK